MNQDEFPRLTFDDATGRVPELVLSDEQYVTLVSIARCPVGVSGTNGAASARCRQPLLLPFADWSADGGRTGQRSLSGDWLCADGHGPADYVASC